MSKILALFLCLNQFFFAQFKNILISKKNTPKEVSIAINPKNTNQIVAGANLNNQYYSVDGGYTWHEQHLQCNEYGVYGDPVIFWDNNNGVYFLHLANPSKPTPNASFLDRIVIQKSNDFGKTFPMCVGIGKNNFKVQDKPWATINTKNNSIHLTWTQFDKYKSTLNKDVTNIMYSQSIDGGLTWTNPTSISKFKGDCLDNDNTIEGATPAIGTNNELYVVWASGKGLMFQKSLDNGNTWLNEEKKIIDTPGGWAYSMPNVYRANGLPITATDLSDSKYRGTLYINWSDSRFEQQNIGINLIRSSNSGNTWSNPLQINIPTKGITPFLTTMCIDQTNGNIYIFYYQAQLINNKTMVNVILAASNDGAKTFVYHQINEIPFETESKTFLGDYIGIAAVNNVIRPIWTQTNGSESSIYTAIINGDHLFKKK